jgi:hypothetical protein
VAAIVRDLPITNKPTKLMLSGGSSVDAKHDQIILWLSATRPGLGELPPSALRFPAVLDTGFNSTFLIAERHLQDWANLRLVDLNWFDFLMADGHALPYCDLDVWIHPNQPGFIEPMKATSAVRIEKITGAAIWPVAIPGARRLPLLGLTALRRAGFQVHIDGSRGRVTIGRSHWYSSFGWVR